MSFNILQGSRYFSQQQKTCPSIQDTKLRYKIRLSYHLMALQYLQTTNYLFMNGLNSHFVCFMYENVNVYVYNVIVNIIVHTWAYVYAFCYLYVKS